MPGAMIALRHPANGRVLFTRRADDGTWSLPAGAAEPGRSFAATAMASSRRRPALRWSKPTSSRSRRYPRQSCTRSSIRTETNPSRSRTPAPTLRAASGSASGGIWGHRSSVDLLAPFEHGYEFAQAPLAGLRFLRVFKSVEDRVAVGAVELGEEIAGGLVAIELPL